MNDEEIIKLIHYTLNKLNLSYMEDELIDIAYIGCSKAINTFKDDKGSFSNYLFSCIKNEISHYFYMSNFDKRKANFNTLSLNYPILGSYDELIDLIPDNYNLENNVDSKIICDYINKIAKKILTKSQFEVYELIYIHQYNVTETAKKLNKTKTCVGWLRKKAIAKLLKDKKVKELKKDYLS